MFYFTRKLFSQPFPVSLFLTLFIPLTLSLDIATLPFQLIAGVITGFGNFSWGRMDTKELEIVAGSEDSGVRHLLVRNKNSAIGRDNSLTGTAMPIKDLHIVRGFEVLRVRTITVADNNEQQLRYRFVSNSVIGDHYIEDRSPAEIEALSELSNSGLRNEHLRSWRMRHLDTFGQGHKDALKLLLGRGNTVQNAIAEINELNEHQAKALALLYKSGLKAEHLRAWQAPQFGNFSKKHSDALEFLATKGVTGENAINEINGLNEHQVIALKGLYESGLRGTHLRSWQEPKYGEFGRQHTDTLVLLETKRITGQEAINRINGLDEQALRQKFSIRGNYKGTMWGTDPTGFEEKEEFSEAPSL
jgi:hypothetical protein